MVVGGSKPPAGDTDARREQSPVGGLLARSAASSSRAAAVSEVPQPFEGSTSVGQQGRAGGQLQEGSGVREGVRLCGWGSTLEGTEPQGRDRHETRPAGAGRSKALRACETLRGHVPGCGTPGQGAAWRWEDVEGGETAREAAAAGATLLAAAPQQPNSGGERKVKRGCSTRGHSRRRSVGEDLRGQPQGEGQRGSEEPIRSLAAPTDNTLKARPTPGEGGGSR